MNRIITVDEAVSGLLTDIKQVAKDLGISDMALAVAFGAMCGAPLAENDIEWAVDEISGAKI